MTTYTRTVEVNGKHITESLTVDVDDCDPSGTPADREMMIVNAFRARRRQEFPIDQAAIIADGHPPVRRLPWILRQPQVN